MVEQRGVVLITWGGLLTLQGWLGVSQAGLATMAVGLLVEGVADWQKSKFKIRERDNFISRWGMHIGIYLFAVHGLSERITVQTSSIL